MNKRNNITRCGFTLIELLTTIAIIILVIGITFPTILGIRNSTVVSNGVNAVKAGITSARVYALKKQTFTQDLDNNGGRGKFSGTAVIFTPANEMRITVNDETAATAGGYLELNGINGYKDVETRSYIKIPDESGVVGITRRQNGDLVILPPPFALRFDEYGYQVVGVPDAGVTNDKVYYDIDYKLESNNEVRYETDARAEDYNVNMWDPLSDQFDNTNDAAIDPDTAKYKLPFGQIESVLAVIVYSKIDFANEGGNIAFEGNPLDKHGTTPTTFKNKQTETPYASVAEWMQLNGKVLMISRMTGTLMEEHKEMRITR